MKPSHLKICEFFIGMLTTNEVQRRGKWKLTGCTIKPGLHIINGKAKRKHHCNHNFP